MKPPHATNKSKKQKERRLPADGRSSEASSQHPTQSDRHHQDRDALASAVDFRRRSHRSRDVDEDETPEAAELIPHRACKACRRKRIKCRHARAQRKSLCETHSPPSGSASDTASYASGSSASAIRETSDITEDISSSSEDSFHSISDNPIARFEKDLSRDANPVRWLSGSLPNGNDLRWKTKDGTIATSPRITLDLFHESLGVHGNFLSRQDEKLSPYVPAHGSESLSVFLSRFIPNITTWRLADGQMNATMPLRPRGTSVRPSGSQINRRRRARRTSASAGRGNNIQMQRNALSLASGPPSRYSASQAMETGDSRPPEDPQPPPEMSNDFLDPGFLQLTTASYPSGQDFGNGYMPSPIAGIGTDMLYPVGGERMDSGYQITNTNLQQHLPNTGQWFPETTNWSTGEGQHEPALSAPMYTHEQTQMVYSMRETPVVHDATTLLSQYDYNNVTSVGAHVQPTLPLTTQPALDPPYDHTTPYLPINETSTYPPSLDLNSTLSDPSGQYARSNFSGFWDFEDSTLGLGAADASNNAYMHPPTGSMSTMNEVVPGVEKPPFSDQEYLYYPGLPGLEDLEE